MNATCQKYGAGEIKRRRIVLVLPEDEVQIIDEWGVPAGMPSRTQAIRTLINRGLKSIEENKKADAFA